MIGLLKEIFGNKCMRSGKIDILVMFFSVRGTLHIEYGMVGAKNKSIFKIIYSIR